MSDATADLPPVLLVHGFATSAARTWGDNGWIDLIGDMGRTVLAPDLLGHGTAPKPHDPAAYVDLGGTLAEALPQGPVDAIGFSLGAKVLLGLAVDDPTRFRRLVVAGVGANLFRTDGSDVVRRAVGGDADPADPVARYFAGLAADPEADPQALGALLDGDQRRLTTEDVGRVTCPALVVLGDRDFAGPPDPLVEALPEARLVVLPRTDHFATPKEFRFIDAALDFIVG
ncbi:MAG: alpha/beta fold hydrolase [Acidimicrobiales bacterium]